MYGSSTSWNSSRSPVTMITSSPRSRAWVARVAITSSASKPAFSTIGIFSVSTTWRIRPICWRRMSGASERPSL